MLLNVAKAIEAAGAQTHVSRPLSSGLSDYAALTVELDGAVVELAVTERRRSPYPADVPKLTQSLSTRGRRRPMLVAPFIGTRVGDMLIEAGWSWADAAGNFDIKARRFRFRQRLSTQALPRQQRVLPQGSGSTTIVRWLLSKGEVGAHIDLAVLRDIGRVSQPRVSQLMRTLAQQGLLSHEGRAYRLIAIEPILDAFLDDYRGPGGSQRYAYTLDTPSDFAARAVEVLRHASAEGAFAFSADVGPNLIASWRKPTHVVMYLRESIALDTFGLVEASGRADANVLLRMPADDSIFSAPEQRRHGSTTIPLVNVPQMMWDLLDLGGEDRREAAGRLREWWLQHRQMS